MKSIERQGVTFETAAWIVSPPLATCWESSPELIHLVGRKARGLSVLPRAWRPPFAVLSTAAYAEWSSSTLPDSSILTKAARLIEDAARPWRLDWPRGLILRSSANDETLEDRGANESLRLAADYGSVQIVNALQSMFRSFLERGTTGLLAVIVQPLVSRASSGHLSNERRVSKTVNQWKWERLSPDVAQGNFNSWRDTSPQLDGLLETTSKALVRTFGAVGRWVTSLDNGPAHLEWIYDERVLWLVQIDFEHEQPDNGIDPNDWLREDDHIPTGLIRPESPLRIVDLHIDASTSWKKVANAKWFAEARREPYPTLACLTGDRLLESAHTDRAALEADLEKFAHGRIVCRTDCRTEGVSRENLPRTNTVSSTSAVEHMLDFLQMMSDAGSSANDVCFLLHKFIPARSGAWVSVDPGTSVVRVDSLWGVPDGLQYLPHDTFDVDVRTKMLLAERIRYKPRFMQECNDGSWQELKVRRSLGRTRSLSSVDVIDIASISLSLAQRVGRPLLIMWFCGIPGRLGIGTNLPWFSMPPNPVKALTAEEVAPRWPYVTLRTIADVRTMLRNSGQKHILVLDPELSLFRSGQFLDDVVELAKRDNCPVQLAGSTLAHAHYQLEKAGVTVLPADGPLRSRTRGRRNFDKLVRNAVPTQIESRGEVVLQSRLPRSEMRRALAAKLFEEIQELLSATDPDDVTSELGDLLEVIRAMAEVTGVRWSDVETGSASKREQRGGFADGAVLVGTEWPARDRIIQRIPQMVSLRSLGKVISQGNSTLISYNALAASINGVDLRVGGHRITVRLTSDGLSIQSGGAATPESKQLELPFENTQPNKATWS